MTYQPIENYGVIGNLHTVALVGTNGSIDWLCFPHFDSPSVFGAILDDRKGGRFSISPSGEKGVTYKQLYWPDTNVLVTRFLSSEGVAEVTDFMPVKTSPLVDSSSTSGSSHHRLIRRVMMIRGQMHFRMLCQPAFDYARAPHTISEDRQGVVFQGPGISLGLATRIPLEREVESVTASFQLEEGESVTFVLYQLSGCVECGPKLSEGESDELFHETVVYWQNWLSRCTYRGRWREMVHRSALILKLLTYEPTGAIVAAPTTSLPEGIGGERNWDYRYTWIRDAAFTVYGLLRIGFTEEAGHFMSWVEERIKETGPGGSLQVMYGIDGRHQLEEETLPHLDGYRNSRPVRIGNGAYSQLQLDIYGELMDSVYLCNKYVAPITYDYWTQLRRLINWVVENWHRQDEGIWEVRGGQRHFTFSKLMCWVALDRGLRLADKRSFPAERAGWLSVRDQLYEEIMQRGWSERRSAFVQSYESDVLDASNLLMPLVFFLAPNDRRMLSTLEAILRDPDHGGLVSNGLTYRYNVTQARDGLTGEEGTFTMCSFWLIEALTRAGRVGRHRLDDARLLFEKMLGYANHLGLYAEQIGAQGEALGNFPQAFTHLALISAAYNLDKTLG